MPRRNLNGCRAIITGASSGIGRALALALAAQDVRLVITARREDRLQELAADIAKAGGVSEPVAGDITQPECRQQVLDRCLERFGGLDLLVNNAGLGAFGRFATARPDRLRQIMEVNFFAPVELTRLCLPALRTGNKPMIVNIGSILGRRGIPHASEYCASKFALSGFSEAIRAELAAEGIDVLLVSPGTTQTDFFSSVIEKEAELPWEKYPGVSPGYVARKTVRAIRAGAHEIVPSFRGRMLIRLNRYLPRATDALMKRFG